MCGRESQSALQGLELKVKYTDAQKDRVSNLLQVFCYFCSTYEVLIDADEHLSTLLGPADLLVHLKALVDLPSAQLVSTIKYYAREACRASSTGRKFAAQPLPWMKSESKKAPAKSGRLTHVQSSCARSHVGLATGG